MTTDRDFF